MLRPGGHDSKLISLSDAVDPLVPVSLWDGVGEAMLCDSQYIELLAEVCKLFLYRPSK